MLYLFHSTDISRAREKARGLAESLRRKRPDAAFVRVSEDTFSREALEELVETQGLFVRKCIVLLEAIAASDRYDILLEFLPRVAESENIFIAVEGAIPKPALAAYEKHAHEVREVKELATKNEKREAFNVFSLADALAQKNTLALWSGYLAARRAGIEPEAIAGTLFWQLKALVLAKGTASAEEAGLKPFVFSKARRAAAHFSGGELNAALCSLVTIYHEAHRGGAPLEYALEGWCLMRG